MDAGCRKDWPGGGRGEGRQGGSGVDVLLQQGGLDRLRHITSCRCPSDVQ